MESFNFSLSADENNCDAQFPETLRHEIQNAIKELRQLKAMVSSKDVEYVKGILEQLWLKNCLPGFTTAEKICKLDTDTVPWYLIASDEYSNLLQAVSHLITNEWPGQTVDSNEIAIFNLFKIDNNFEFIMESWLCLTKYLEKTPQSIMAIFEFLLEDNSLLPVTFLLICKEKAELMKQFKSTINTLPEPKIEQFNIKIKEFLQLLMSLPTRLANALCGQIKDIYMANNYAKKILQHILKAIWFLIHCEDKEKQFFDIKFLSNLLSRLVLDFGNNLENNTGLFEFLQILQELCAYPQAQKCIEEIFLLIDDNYTSIYRLALCMLNGSLDVYKILGDCAQRNELWQLCFLHKLVVQKLPYNDTALLTLVRYISSVDDGMLRQLLENVLNVWSKRIALQKLSQMEHLNLSKLLIISAKFYYSNGRYKTQEDFEIKSLLHKGLRHHLECPDSLQRHIGMKTVEMVFNFITGPNAQEEEQLRFDYDGILDTPKGEILKEIDILNNSIQLENKATEYANATNLEILLENFMTNKNTEITSLRCSHPTAQQVPDKKVDDDIEIDQPPAKSPKMELDSDDDDDLKPYDMSNDTPQILEKRPKFLLDLLSTLSTKCENYEYFESALSTAENLIRTQLPKSDARIGVDLMQLFLTLDMQYYYENFDETKFKCCVAICSIHPAECAEYICRQFHTDNSCYNANLRILMLQILAGTVKELCGADENVNENYNSMNSITAATPATHLRKFQFDNEHQKSLALARQTIRLRLREKTKRYFSKAKMNCKTKPNRFHSVVGTFFFSLIRGNRTKQMLYVKYDRIAQDIDTMLLVNFLHTLSIIVMGAQNCPILPTIAREVFDMCAFVRFSSEPRVRLSCLELLGITLVTTPEYILIEQFNDRLLELRYWLEDFIKSPLIGGESSEECRELASQILNTCYKILNPGDFTE